jgi:hypothetical protein
LAKITLADLTSEPTTIELFGHEYRVLAITRSVQKKLEKAQPSLESLPDEEDSDKVVAVLADAIDAVLAADAGAPAARKAIVDAWKRDELSLSQISALSDKVQEASAARPT